MSLKSRITRTIDRCAGYLGLFLIGLIGWYCDRRGSAGRTDRSPRHIDSGVRPVRRFVD